jgi:hypothetical protein
MGKHLVTVAAGRRRVFAMHQQLWKSVRDQPRWPAAVALKTSVTLLKANFFDQNALQPNHLVREKL